MLEELEVCAVDAERLLDELFEVLRRELVDDAELEEKLLELNIVFEMLETVVKEVEEIVIAGEGEELPEELLAELED